MGTNQYKKIENNIQRISEKLNELQDAIYDHEQHIDVLRGHKQFLHGTNRFIKNLMIIWFFVSLGLVAIFGTITEMAILVGLSCLLMWLTR